MTNLYYVRNTGCHDETCGLVYISDEDFPKFKEFIENLNKNSTYGCQPTIDVYKISPDDIREATDEDSTYRRLYLGDKIYVIKESYYYEEQEKVI